MPPVSPLRLLQDAAGPLFDIGLLAKGPAVFFVWEAREGWPVQFVTDNIAERLGYAAETFLEGRQSFQAILHPDDAEWVAEESERLVDQGAEGYSLPDYRVIHGDGSTRWVQECGVIRRDSHGRSTHFVGCLMDVTERHEVEDELRRSEQRFRSFADASSDWFWEMGPDLRFSYFSDRIREVLGADPADMLGLSREDLAGHETGSDLWRRHLDDLTNRRVFRNFRYPLKRRDGVVQHIKISGMPVFDERGRFQGYRGTGTNITAEVEAERDYHALFEHVPHGLYRSTSDGRWLRVNEALVRLAGYPSAQAMLEADSDEAVSWFVDPEQRDRFVTNC